MNVALFDTDLALALGDGVSAAGADGAVYTAAARRAATARAVREYSRYRPRLRRYGTADLFQDAAAGAAQVLVVGGGFRAGDAVTLDPWGAAESGAVASVAPATVFTGAPVLTMAVTAVTLAAPLALAHPSGTFLTQQSPGLALQTGRDTYPLPADWDAPDWASFDAAVGAAGARSAGPGYYDASYGLVEALSAANAGDRADVGVNGALGGPWPFSGDPAYNPNGAAGAFGGAGAGMLYRFYQGDPPRLRVSPAPGAARTLDFDYLGEHAAPSVPDADADAVQSYACYAARMARATDLARRADRKVGDVQTRWADAADKLRALAAADLAEFERRVCARGVLLSG